MYLPGLLLSLTLCHHIGLATCWSYVETTLKGKRLQCSSEGRFADLDNCGLFNECVPGGHKGELVAHKKSCHGHAFHPGLKTCVPEKMVQGCIQSLRSFNVADPKFQDHCTMNNTQQNWVCGDCNTVILCVDGVPHTDQCSSGSSCLEDSRFGGAVCYPNEPSECSCRDEHILQKDHYDASKFLNCGPKDSEPTLHTCPDGLYYDDAQGTCCTENSCAPELFEVKDNCMTYISNILTIGGWIQKEVTCVNKTMFNVETGNCEDPCQWDYDFTCEQEGRFAHPSNCTRYFECITDSIYSAKFIKKELACPTGYNWRQILNSSYGTCVKITYEDECVPVKNNNCQIPHGWCAVPTADQCRNEGGICVETGTSCSGDLMILQNTIEDHCFCCMDECLRDNGGCGEHNCTNTDGAHFCVCNNGYELRTDNKTCQDIDECLIDNGSCEQSCTNTDGAYFCVCNDGYELRTDNTTCQVVPDDDCSLPFVVVNGQCLLFIEDNRASGWDDARKFCQSYNDTDIAILTDIQIVAEYMQTNKLPVTWWHIGANNRGDKRKHTWINGVDVTEGWLPNKPSLLTDDHCVHIHPDRKGTGEGFISDNVCNPHMLPFICYKTKGYYHV